MEIFSQILNSNQILLNESMKKHTTFRIGGNTKVLLLPETTTQILSCIEICRKNNLKYYIIGNGSNLLVSDKGFDGVIIKISKNFNKIECKNNIIKAQAGASLSAISKIAYENSLSGLEFALGIPGTIGGGVCMNAGAYGSELKNIIKSVTVIQDGKIKTLDNKACEFEYRNSKILKEKLIVLEVLLELCYSDKSQILNTMKTNTKTRNQKQPVEYPSAGSTFKRPKDNFAGKLIMEAGLAGKTVGDACISSKHCGFIINLGNASCNDVLSLIDIAYKEVKEKFNISLEKEIRILGES